MREILFRGKTPSDEANGVFGQWVTGFYTCFNGKEHRIYNGYAETDCGDYYPDWCNVIPDTVGQFTGLTDKNGTKIFGGDIVKLFLKDNLCEIGPIMWSDIGMRYKFASPDGTAYSIDITNVYEVIGNIHDNQELLKAGER